MEKQKVVLACEVCLTRNYSILKSKSTNKRLELKKFCPICGKHTKHIETK